MLDGYFLMMRRALAMGMLAATAIGVPLVGASGQVQQRTAPEPDHSGFRVCNKTNQQIEVAKALNTSTNGKPAFFISEGWFKMDPGQCFTLWPGDLKYRYYLLYAQNKQTRREWAGNISVCVSQQPFTIQHGFCEQGNYQRKFFQVDTGEETSWTQNFTD